MEYQQKPSPLSADPPMVNCEYPTAGLFTELRPPTETDNDHVSARPAPRLYLGTVLWFISVSLGDMPEPLCLLIDCGGEMN